MIIRNSTFGDWSSLDECTKVVEDAHPRADHHEVGDHLAASKRSHRNVELVLCYPVPLAITHEIM
jgi:hypothetical protein